MTLYLAVPLLVLVALLQTSAMPHLTILGVFPDLPLLVVVSWSLLRGAREGAVWGLIAGVAVDLLSGAPDGAATLGLVAAGLLSGVAQATAFRGYAALPLISAFVATLVYDLVFLVIVAVSGRPVAWLDSLLRVVLPAALVNTALAPAVYWVVRKISRRLGREEMGW